MLLTVVFSCNLTLTEEFNRTLHYCNEIKGFEGPALQVERDQTETPLTVSGDWRYLPSVSFHKPTITG